MLKRTMTFEDFNGNARTEEFHFNLTKAEITQMQLSVTGTLTEKIQRIMSTQDGPEIIALFKDLIIRSFGEKTLDGRGFVKTPAGLESFTSTNAFSDLFMELATDSKAAAAFVSGIIPADLAKEAELEAAKLQAELDSKNISTMQASHPTIVQN